MHKNRAFIVVVALLIVNLAISAFILIMLFTPVHEQPSSQSALAFEQEENGQYILSIGLNDKDTYEQIIPTDEAEARVNAICVKYVSGYTVSVASGGWVDENGILTQENTLIYTFTGADETSIISIMDEVLVALNQNSVLLEKQDVLSVLYNGT